ncbi:helix-turn-helix domain-containing protein, partial [Streptomyces tauricus]
SLRYAVAMRYAQGGGLTPQGQAARERVRMLAVDGFARDEKNTMIAKELRVSVRSVERWRTAPYRGDVGGGAVEQEVW